jgi:hypothetical protein
METVFPAWSVPRNYLEDKGGDLFKSVRLSVNIKRTLHKARVSNDLRLSRLGISDRRLPLKIAAPAKQGSLHHWKFSKVHTSRRFAHSCQPSLCVLLYKKIVQERSRSHTKS